MNWNWKFWETPTLSAAELAERTKHAKVVRTNEARLDLKIVRDRTILRENHLGENVKKAMGG